MSESTTDLEIKAAEERRRLQASFEGLKARVQDTLDVDAQLRKQVFPIAGIAGLAAAVLGYGLAGIFTRR